MNDNGNLDDSSKAIVYIIDDDDAVLDSISILLKSIGIRNKTYASANAFLDDYVKADFEKEEGCIVLDIRMPGINGMDCQTRLNELNNVLPIVIVTGHGDVPMAIQAMKKGAFDFMEKPFREQTLLTSVQKAIDKSIQTHHQLEHIARSQANIASLTHRELETLTSVVDGKSNKAIADELNISERTVEVHRANLMEKMEASSLAHLIRLYLDVYQNT